MSRTLAAKVGSLDSLSAPDALHRSQADARDLGHHPAGPVSDLAGRLAQGQGYNPFGHLVSQLRDPRGPRLIVQQTRHALFHEPRLPTPDGGLADTGCAHDRRCAQPVGRGQHDPGAPDVLLGLLRLSTITCRRLRSVGFKWTVMPVRILKTRTPANSWESHKGLLCRHQSTSELANTSMQR